MPSLERVAIDSDYEVGQGRSFGSAPGCPLWRRGRVHRYGGSGRGSDTSPRYGHVGSERRATTRWSKNDPTREPARNAPLLRHARVSVVEPALSPWMRPGHDGRAYAHLCGAHIGPRSGGRGEPPPCGTGGGGVIALVETVLTPSPRRTREHLAGAGRQLGGVVGDDRRRELVPVTAFIPPRRRERDGPGRSTCWQLTSVSSHATGDAQGDGAGEPPTPERGR
jgi:hypothetical protein